MIDQAPVLLGQWRRLLGQLTSHGVNPSDLVGGALVTGSATAPLEVRERGELTRATQLVRPRLRSR